MGESKGPACGSIERLDPRLDRLIAAEAEIEILSQGFQWCEGPVWIPREDSLLFSDVPANRIFQWRPGGAVRVFMEASGFAGGASTLPEPGSNGLTLDSLGRLTLCEHGDRRITRLEPQGGKTVLASRYQGKRLNSPNDLCYRSSGDLYFTDPPYGLGTQDEDDPAKELDFQGVFRLTPQGDLRLQTQAMSRPNGLAFSPDEKTLYVANSDPRLALWMAYPVDENGDLGEGRVFFDATRWVDEDSGLPDGLKVDRQGNLFAAGPGGVLVLGSDGAHLGTIRTGRKTSNCAWGEKGSTLFVTAHRDLLRLSTLTLGAGW